MYIMDLKSATTLLPFVEIWLFVIFLPVQCIRLWRRTWENWKWSCVSSRCWTWTFWGFEYVVYVTSIKIIGSIAECFSLEIMDHYNNKLNSNCRTFKVADLFNCINTMAGVIKAIKRLLWSHLAEHVVVCLCCLGK